MTSFKRSPSLNAIKVRFVGVLTNSKGNWCYKSNQVTGCLIGNWGYFEAFKQFLPVHQWNNSFSHLSSLARFFINNIFIRNAKMKFPKNQAKAKENPEAELLLLRNYSLSSSTLSSKSNKRYSETCGKNKYVCFHAIMWLMTM